MHPQFQPNSASSVDTSTSVSSIETRNSASSAETPSSACSAETRSTYRRSTTKSRRRIVQACALVAALVLLPSAVSACSSNDAVSSGQSTQSGQSGVADVPMSGDYEVGSDGKLKLPANRLPSKPSDSALILDQHTDVSADIFGQYFIQTVEYAWNTGDTSTISELCLSESKGCKDLIDQINDIYSKGGWFDRGDYQVRQVLNTQPFTQSGANDVTAVAYWVTGTTNNSYDGQTLYEQVDVDQMQWEVHLKQTEHSWIVQSLSIDILEDMANKE